jgi:peroxiredoxin
MKTTGVSAARQFALFGILVGALALQPGIAEQSEQQLYQVPGTPEAPDFTLTDIEGTVHTLSSYRGRVVLVNFWATWCPPCREEMPAMQRAWEKLQDQNVALLAIDVGEDEDTIFEFTANYPVEFPLLMDLDSSVVQDWPVRGLPTTFIIDRRGRIIYRAIGAREWDSADMLETIRALD